MLNSLAIRKHFADTTEQKTALDISNELRLGSSFAVFFPERGVPTLIVDCLLVLNTLSLGAAICRHERSFLVDKSRLRISYH